MLIVLDMFHLAGDKKRIKYAEDTAMIEDKGAVKEIGETEETNIHNQSLRPLALDTDKYRADLQEFELTAQQENELLQVLWDIMVTMVDIGFGDHSIQRVVHSLMKSTSPDSLNELKRYKEGLEGNKAIFADAAKEVAKNE